MRRVIWEFEIENAIDCMVKMPAINQIVEARIVPSTRRITLWALCDSERPLVEKTFMVLPTGATYDRPDEKVVKYVWTVFDDEHNLVWHIFEVLGEKSAMGERAIADVMGQNRQG